MRRRWFYRFSVGTSAALITVTVLGGRTQGQTQPAPTTPRETVFPTEVAVVAVPVFVFDKTGRAASNLTAADFEIEEQGKKVPIVAFEAIDAGETELPPAISQASPTVQAAARRQFIFLFDLQFATPTGLMRARNAALKFVDESMSPSDLATVATYARSGLKILTSLTTDRRQVGRAIMGLGLVHTNPLDTDALNLATESDFTSGPGNDGMGGLGVSPDPSVDITARLEAQRDYRGLTQFDIYLQRVLDFLDQLEELSKTLGTIRGRKQILLFSAGFDPRTWGVRLFDDNSDVRVRSRMDDLFKQMAASDTVIHALDITGLETGVSAQAGRVVPDSGKNTLATFALNTGGRFIKDMNNLEVGLKEVFETSRYYYVLAFEPSDPAKARKQPRSLKVRVLRDGLSVSHRASYILPDDTKEKDPNTLRLRAAEAIAKGLTGGPVGLHVVALPYRGSDGRSTVSAVLSIDGRPLVDSGGASNRTLEIYGYAMAGGRVLDAFALSPALDLSKLGGRLERNGLQVMTAFNAIEGPIDLRFFVRDKSSGLWGSIRSSIEMPSFEGVVVSPPLLVDDPQDRVAIPFASRARPKLENPFRIGEARFVPDAKMSLPAGQALELCSLVWRGVGAGEKPPLRVTAQLIAAGEPAQLLPMSTPPRVVSDSDGFERYLATVVIPAGAKGSRTLRLEFRAAEEAAAVAHSETQLNVN